MRTLGAIALLTLSLVACGSITTTGGTGGAGGGTGQGGATGGAGPGTGGTGGTGGAGGASCAQLQTEYASALARAKTCSPNLASQCGKTAPDQLACPCPTFVNDTAGLDAIKARWSQAGCQDSTVCPAIACVSPRSATCRPSDAGGASCVDDSSLPTP
jgi:hypothetical protein